MLPAWNPHEVLGAPFAANLQGFPWIPTRLILLLFDPTVAYAVGVAIAAALAATFTYLFARRAGLTQIAAAAAGWTFACAGFFSSRVMAGHLPLLEAYPALPMLLWLADRALTPGRARWFRLDLGLLAIACTFVVAAGHPQVPAYALASAFVYVAWWGRGVALAVRARVAAAMALGVGLALVLWWPMLLLIGRSTRILHLAAPDNDVNLPYSRVLALIIPGLQGWAAPIALADNHPFDGFANNAWFWDTASYVGLLPLAAIAGLLVVAIARKRMPDWRSKYLIFMGVSSFVCALPLADALLHALPGTFLRSPARLLYISTFCAAIAMGAGIETIRRMLAPHSAKLQLAAVTAVLAVHGFDLARFDHWFIQTYARDTDAGAFQSTLDKDATRPFRIAEERDDEVFPYEDRFDDAGGFDSIFLARFNRAYVTLAGQPLDTNEQVFDASILSPQALSAFGVRYVVTTEERKDLTLTSTDDEAKLYQVEGPTPRASFFTADTAEFAPPAEIPQRFAANPQHRLILEGPGQSQTAAPHAPTQPVRTQYERPSTDQIQLSTESPQPGYAYILESWDPGWHATLDGAPALVLPANGFAMAIATPAGPHHIDLHYETPGRTTGALLSLLSLATLTALIALSPRAR